MSIIKFIKKLFRRKGKKPATNNRLAYRYAIHLHGYEATIFVEFGVSRHGYGAYILLPDGTPAPIVDGGAYRIFDLSPKELIAVSEDTLHKWVESIEKTPLQNDFKELGFKLVNK